MSRSTNSKVAFSTVEQVTLGGLLGQALKANQGGRLAHFIENETSPAIALFGPAHKSQNHEGDWYGEHAGKWLYAAARSAARSGNEQLSANVRRVADYLISVQDPDGYMGTYAPTQRFMVKQQPGPRSWNGAPGVRSWDIWNHTYLILGFLELHKVWGEDQHLAAARRIGDLCWRTLSAGQIKITELGNHHGMSATVLLDAAIDLHVATGESTYFALAELILAQADQHPELALLQQALAGIDAADISTGKAYQLCWNLVGLAKLHKVSGNADYLQAVRNVWRSIRQHHLTLGGGPWGGVGMRSREIFNHPGYFNPQAYVETCSTLSWIQLNRELLAITGEAKYAEEIEWAAYNDLLGAQAPNGEDWCYYSFPNGKRVYTTYWRCCKSSGAMALEELPAIAYGVTAEQDLLVNLYGPSQARLVRTGAGAVSLTQTTDYPFDGAIRITVKPETPARFAILLRIPAWAHGAGIEVNGVAWSSPATPGDYLPLTRDWRDGDSISLQFPMVPVLHRKTNRNMQESIGPLGEPIDQEVLHFDYMAISRGPLVYATGLIDGYKMEETLRIPAQVDAGGEGVGKLLEVIAPVAGSAGPAIRLHLDDRAPLIFSPYYEAGGREDGAWRLTWMQVTPESMPQSAKNADA